MKVSRRDNLDRFYLLSLWGYALFAHHMHHDEMPDVFHSHPWDGWSVLFGRYLEERMGEKPKVRWGFNVIRATRFHRVSLPYGPVWSLFFHFRRKKDHRWQVKHRDGRVLDEEPWRGVGGRGSYVPEGVEL